MKGKEIKVMEYLKADQRVPNMGLENKICENPKYWCRKHQVWMSEEDVEKKGCKCKLSADMMSTKRCGNLEEKDYDAWLKKF